MWNKLSSVKTFNQRDCQPSYVAGKRSKFDTLKVFPTKYVLCVLILKSKYSLINIPVYPKMELHTCHPNLKIVVTNITFFFFFLRAVILFVSAPVKPVNDVFFERPVF